MFFQTSTIGYYAWRTRPASAREMANRDLYQQIEAVCRDNRGVYGSQRIYRELKDQGVACSQNRVARLMRLRGLKAKQSKRFRSTTKRNQADAAAPNLLKRDFKAEQPAAIATLRRDFDATLTFFRIQAVAAQRGQLWPARQLHTTSPLEREFRPCRRRLTGAVLFHSPSGLAAVIRQWLVRRSTLAANPLPRQWHHSLERALAAVNGFS